MGPLMKSQSWYCKLWKVPTVDMCILVLLIHLLEAHRCHLKVVRKLLWQEKGVPHLVSLQTNESNYHGQTLLHRPRVLLYLHLPVLLSNAGSGGVTVYWYNL